MALVNYHYQYKIFSVHNIIICISLINDEGIWFYSEIITEKNITFYLQHNISFKNSKEILVYIINSEKNSVVYITLYLTVFSIKSIIILCFLSCR